MCCVCFCHGEKCGEINGERVCEWKLGGRVLLSCECVTGEQNGKGEWRECAWIGGECW